MSERIGMNAEQASSLAGRLQGQVSVLQSVASTVNAAAAVSLNPLSYGIQPGGLLIAPFAIGATQVAAAKVRGAASSAEELAQTLFAEISQQRIASSATSNSYRNGFLPPTPGATRKPGLADFWSQAFGAVAGGVIGPAVGFAALAAGTADVGLSAMRYVGKVSSFFRGASSVFAGITVFTGGYDLARGISEGDGYRSADGLISIGVGAAGIIAAVGLVSNPVGWVIGGAALLWGAAQLISGDVPVTRRIGDFFGGVGSAAADVGRGVGDFMSDATRSITSWFR